MQCTLHCPALQETNALVDRMQKDLNELQPVLATKTVDTQRLLVEVGFLGFEGFLDPNPAGCCDCILVETGGCADVDCLASTRGFALTCAPPRPADCRPLPQVEAEGRFVSPLTSTTP